MNLTKGRNSLEDEITINAEASVSDVFQLQHSLGAALEQHFLCRETEG